MKVPNYMEAKKREKRIFDIESFKFNDDDKEVGVGKTYFVKTYGCQMNEHDSENIKAILECLGYTESDDYEKSDLILLNTCSIRENAHNKAFGMLGRVKHLKEINPNIIVGVCGCMAQEEGVVERLKKNYRFVNFVFGTHNLYDLPKVLKESINTSKQEIEVLAKEEKMVEDIPVKRASSHKAFVNIIYGCDKFCTYCIVPYTRGSQRSRRYEDIVVS